MTNFFNNIVMNKLLCLIKISSVDDLKPNQYFSRKICYLQLPTLKARSKWLMEGQETYINLTQPDIT